MPTEPTVPDEAAVEAAARALCRVGEDLLCRRHMHGAKWSGWCSTGLADARAAVAAAQPILDAQTGERIAAELETGPLLIHAKAAAALARRVGGSGA